MNKKGSSLLLLALLLGLPGCGGRDKSKDKAAKPKAKMSKKVAQAGTEGEMTMAAADELSDESLRSFFDGMEEFVALNDDELEQAVDQFVWADADDNDLEPLYFEFGKASIDDEQESKLALNADQARKLLEEARAENPNAQLVVEGHACASAGSHEYNKLISEKRAQQVADRLIQDGIEPSALKVVGRGCEALVVDGDREEQWPNRRVELHVVRA